MQAPNDNSTAKGLRGWWASPPRAGLRRIISPWEYRHLRAFARVRIASAVLLSILGLTTLSLGGSDAKTYWFALVFLAAGAVHVAHAYWDLRIARSAAPGT
jgi:hypothetical protein